MVRDYPSLSTPGMSAHGGKVKPSPLQGVVSSGRTAAKKEGLCTMDRQSTTTPQVVGSSPAALTRWPISIINCYGKAERRLAARTDGHPPGWYLNRLEYSLSANDSGSNPDHTDHAELVAPQTLILFPSEKNRQRYLPIRGAITVGSIINGQ